MICVANGTERMSASDELYDLCRLLGMREFAVFRPFSNVDKGAAIAAVWERQGNGPPELKYRMDKDVVWQEGLGTARGGHYGAFRDDARLSTNTGNWHAARPPNAHGLVHHLVN